MTKQLKLRYVSFCCGIAAAACSPALRTRADSWPVVQPLHESHTYLNPGQNNKDTPFLAFVKDVSGESVYRLECHNGNYENESGMVFSGDFQCALFALNGKTLNSGNLLAANTRDEQSSDWWNRGRMRASQFRGECLTYSEYSTDRRFRLRGMLLTLRFTDIAWGSQSDQQGNPRLAKFTFAIDVLPDVAASSLRAKLPTGPQPPHSCYP